MVEMPLSKIEYIVAKAREFDAEVAPSGLDDGNNPADDDEREVIEGTPDNPTESELRAVLFGLNADERAELLALVMIGRGDYGGGDWEHALAEAHESLDDHALVDLAATPMLGDLIEDGLAEVGDAEEE
ncbi:MAG TPA: DUF3775 domain-containing protein [Hyphomicrobiales bacterium]|nr:DUF3775 domain-containing protein [Hyphomicrobiales bacterium]